MKITSIIKLVILFAVFYYVIMFINANETRVSAVNPTVVFPWFFGQNLVVSSPMWVVIGVSMALGFLASAIWMIGKTVIHYFSPSGKVNRSMKKVEEKYYYGIEALSKSDMQSAMVFFEEILALDPDNFRTLVKFGEVLRSMGKHQRAIGLHLHALSLSQNNVKVLHELALDYRAAGDSAKAKEMLERIIEISPKGNNAIYRELRDMLIEEEHWQRALEINRKLIPLVSREGQRKEDLQLQSGLEYEAAMLGMSAGEFQEAKSRLEEITKRDPLFLPAHVTLGECYLELGEDEKAIKTWTDGYSLTKTPVLLGRLEDYHLENESPDKAIEMYHKVIAEEEEDLLPKLLLGKLFYRLEMVDRAIAIFEDIDSEFEYAPVMFYFMGKIKARKGDHKDAAEVFRALIRSSGILEAEYICSNCSATHNSYKPRCSKCGMWNTVLLNVQKGQTLSEMQIPTRPIYA
jgi:lipopolysaccharide biosynthesis regulator YciM